MVTNAVALDCVDRLDDIIEDLLAIRDVLSAYPEYRNRIISAYAALSDVREALYDGEF